MPVDDIHTAEDYARLWRAPIFWWELGGMNANVAAACLGYGYFATTPLTLSENSVVSGASVTGTVSIDGLAPPAGQVVTLSSGNAAAVVPGHVTVTYNQSAAMFTVSTRDVYARTTATLSANLRGTVKTVTLTILPPCDVNDDGFFTMDDVALTLRIAGGMEAATPAQQSIADADGDGAVTAADATSMLRRLTGL
jgi:hypothetical protein